MFGTIRKHQKWLWFVIIAFTIISFVGYFNPAARNSGQGRGSYDFGRIDGQPITADEFRDAQTEVALNFFLRNHQWPERQTDFDMEGATYFRVFQVHKLKEYNIGVDDESVARLAAGIMQNIAQGQPINLDMFVTNVLAGHATAEDFQRFLRHDIGIQQLISLVGLSGDLVTPTEAQALYEHEYQPIAAEVVFFSGSNYLAKIPAPSPQTVAQFYTNEMSAYRLPDRVQLDYVAFSITNHIADAEKELTNLTEEVDSKFREIGTNYLRLGKTPEAAKDRIREELIRQGAREHAYVEAQQFTAELFTNDPVGIENMEVLAKAKGLAVKTTKPFDDVNGPLEMAGETNLPQAAAIGKIAFKLTPEDPFPDRPIVADGAVYIIALDKKIPSEIPPLDQIRDRVMEDYRYSQAVKLAQQDGERFAQSVTNGLAQGKAFAEICAEAKVNPVRLPPVSLSTRELPEVEEHVGFQEFQQVAFATEPGKASEFAPTSEGGMIVYVQQRLPVDQAKMTRELPLFLNGLRQRRQQEVANNWFENEAGKALRDTPFMKRKSQPANPGPG